VPLPPEIHTWVDRLRDNEYLLPPLEPPLCCERCERPLDPGRGYPTCYDCGFSHGPGLVRVSAATYAAVGTRPWELLRHAKFELLPADAVEQRVKAITAAIWATIEKVAPSFLEGQGVVVPVPSSRALIRRCIDQAHAQGWPDLPVRDCLLAEERPRQADLPADGRREAARGKYTVMERLDGADVLLLDDVYTSGFTMHDSARAARDAGATSVAGVVYARRVFPDVMALYREVRDA
jgi:predicted amidophosphoribosyltransferase